MSLCIGSQVWPGHAVLVPIREPEQSLSSPEHTRGIDESLLAQTQRCGLSGAGLAQVSPRYKPKFTEHRHCGGDILAHVNVVPCGATVLLGARTASSCELPEAA